jgi:hypothetical protein
MNPDFDLPAEVAAVVIGAAGVLRFVTRFAAAISPITRPFGGYSEADLAEAEQRLGVSVCGSATGPVRIGRPTS